jgi:hypothetical protein
VLVVLKIFLPFLQKKNERIFFFFFDLTNRQTKKRKDRPNRVSLHSFTPRQEEAFRLKHHFIIESFNTFRERTFYSLERKKRVVSTTRENKARSLFLSVVHEIKESLDDDF